MANQIENRKAINEEKKGALRIRKSLKKTIENFVEVGGKFATLCTILNVDKDSIKSMADVQRIASMQRIKDAAKECTEYYVNDAEGFHFCRLIKVYYGVDANNVSEYYTLAEDSDFLHILNKCARNNNAHCCDILNGRKETTTTPHYGGLFGIIYRDDKLQHDVTTNVEGMMEYKKVKDGYAIK